MQNAMLMAQIFGPYLLVLGLWMLLYSDNLTNIYRSIKSTPAVGYLRSVINMIIGLIIINEYNLWYRNISLLVTLLGWAFFARGVIGLFVPKFIIRLGLSENRMLKIRGIVPFVWGILLLWFGY